MPKEGDGKKYDAVFIVESSCYDQPQERLKRELTKKAKSVVVCVELLNAEADKCRTYIAVLLALSRYPASTQRLMDIVSFNDDSTGREVFVGIFTIILISSLKFPSCLAPSYC